MTTTEKEPKAKDDKEVKDEDQVKEEKVNSEFPRTIGGHVFQTPEELKKYSEEITAQQKEVKAILKEAGKVGRPVSVKRVTSEAIASVLNDNMSEELLEKLEALTEDTAIRITYNPTTQVFSFPTVKSGGGGGGSRGGKTLNVDGVDYPSAKNARDTLHPDTKDKQQNRRAIIAYLKNEKHTIAEE